eukprot:TRINITY_DN22081_c0_g1_i1.p1 TRINITY_DN22081_c0_g1~~TRINITY_DN22081_c0_g1_i1.p1  ORF type:complete len:283 (+),score=60.50 TRINITY_DN22081_c0_g1_i1:128-976(+)
MELLLSEHGLIPNLVRIMAEMMIQEDRACDPEHMQPSSRVVNLVSACRALRVGDVPVCVGIVQNREQCDRVRRGQAVFRMVEMGVGNDELLRLLLRFATDTRFVRCFSLGVRSITDVSGLGQCGSLHTLSLTGCKGIADVSGLGQCSSLDTLDLSYCSGITDVSVLGQCSSLRTLNLSWCTGITDVSLLGQCSSIRTLDLSYCGRIADVSGLGQCGSLHTLNLSSCKSITDVSELGHCGSLHTLDLTGCRGCLLYTSDAADEEDSVDLGGRRIIKKKRSTNR